MWEKFCCDMLSNVEAHWNISLSSQGLGIRFPLKLLDFLSKFDIHPSGCWLFRELSKDGYGRFNWQIEDELYMGAHRVSFVLFNGHIKDQANVLRYHSDLVCHSRNCLSKACAHPNHLRLGTSQDNIHDAIATRKHISVHKDNQGENNPSVILNIDKVKEIRYQLDQGIKTLQDIAKDFGVSTSTIHNIKSGKTWSNVL